MKLNVTKLVEQSYDVDRELLKAIERLQSGDIESFDVIYRHTQRFMFFKAEKLLSTYLNKDSELKADMVQDAYVKIFQNIGSLKEPVKFYGWMNMILINTIYGYCRAHKKEVFDAADGQGDSMVEDLNITVETPEDYVIEQEKRDYINSVLEALPLEQRCTVEYYYFSEMSVEEIAELMQCSEGTVKSRLNYARKKMKGAIEEIEKTKKIKLHSIFAMPLLLLLEKEEALAGLFDAQVAETVHGNLSKELAGGAGYSTKGESIMNENMNQNVNGKQDFQTMEEAAKFASQKSNEVVQSAQAAGQTVTSISTSIWRTTMGKIMVAIMITVVAAGIIWGGIYHFGKEPESLNVSQEPSVEVQEPSQMVEESIAPSVEVMEESVATSVEVEDEPANVEQSADANMGQQTESTEAYVETDPAKMTAKTIGTITLSYKNAYFWSESKGKTPDHMYNAIDIMDYNNGPSSVGNKDMEWKQHREEFEVDGEVVPLWFYEGDREYTETVKWLTGGASDWNDNTVNEKSWGKYNLLPQEVKDIFGPIITKVYDTYYLSDDELRSMAKAIPEEGSYSTDGMGRVFVGSDDGSVYYLENNKVIRLKERITRISWSKTLPNEQNPQCPWESEYYVGITREDGSTEYFKFVIFQLYMSQYMQVNHYTGPEADVAAAAYEFYDEIGHNMYLTVAVYRMVP